MSIKLAIALEGDEVLRDGNSLDYVPYGVKSLKIHATGNCYGKIRLCPSRVSPDEYEMFAHEDSGTPPQFIISWGGGHENYFELDYPRNNYVYFLIHHVGDQDGDYPLTIVAKDESDQVIAELKVNLTYPTDYGEPWPPLDQLVRAQWEEEEGIKGECNINLEGLYTPYYISRWWPENKVQYVYEEQRPRIRLRFCRLISGKNGELSVLVSRQDDDHEIQLARISGSIGYPLYDMRQVLPELYRFNKQTWVLRVWFFWLDLKISREDLSKYWIRTQDEIEQAWRGITSRSEGGVEDLNWHELHEIPDAERVDILFTDDLQPLFGVTDFHWHELWGEFNSPGEPIQVRILNTPPGQWFKDTKGVSELADSGLSIARTWLYNRQSPHKPHIILRDLLDDKYTLGADPLRLESHTPIFLNINRHVDFTSTDVRSG